LVRGSPTGFLLVKPLEPDQRAEESLHAIVDWELAGTLISVIFFSNPPGTEMASMMRDARDGRHSATAGEAPAR